ncbi:MAG: hydrogenase formation protein HypD [Deltaproteobacteria bacterium]|nr:hydrogenase formation protein HypD [Deltaproteobacteria bacterium]
MKYIDEYRDGDIARVLSHKIKDISKKPVRLMEICGTHTMAIFKHGIRSLLPDNIELVSGPGCPVCVTAMEEIDRSAKLARTPGVIVTTFGDILRVVFLGIGFETTAPTIAASIRTAHQNHQDNFSVLSAHKLLPPAMDALLSGGDLGIDGFICPGHVTTIIGTSSYETVVTRYHIPCVVVGFEPIDILQGILMLIEQIEADRAAVEIQYTRGVTANGNPGALRIMDEVFVPCDSPWRGLGIIPGSGLAIRQNYAAHDAKVRFDLEVPPAKEPPGCLCADILRGAARPVDCKLFRNVCSPRNPIGACMVSSEGTCAAYFKYSD